AALWDLRTQLANAEPNGSRSADLLVLQALLLIGKLTSLHNGEGLKQLRRARANYSVGLSTLLQADELLNDRGYRSTILACFARRGIQPAAVSSRRHLVPGLRLFARPPSGKTYASERKQP